MEVSLVEADGLPEGCLLSIRSGSTRRQASVDSKFKLFFPKGGRAGEEVKVDALLPIGTHVLKLEEGKDQYEMDLNGMQVSLHMKEVEQQPLEQDADAKNEIDPHASHRHRVAISARKYLDEHQLLGWAHRLFQDLIHDQPDDPWAYIDQRTGEARTTDLINKAQQKKVEEANLGGLQQAPDLPELPPNLDDDDGVLQTEEEVLDNIRVKAHNALMKAAEDGSLEKALNLGEKSQKPSLEEIRQKAAQHLMKAAQDGSLEKALAGKGMNMDEMDAIRQEAAQTLLRAAEDGSLEAVLSRKTGDQGLDALRQEAAQTLLKAAQDGTLEAVLKKKPTDQDVESIRAQAAATLLKAAEDGTLQKVLSSQSVDQDLDLLRKEAAQTLLKAAEDGSLEAVLKKKGTDQQDLDALRKEAAQTLLKAAQNGTLQSVLSQKTGQDMDKLREDAASLLLRAAEDGTLEAVLSSRVKVQKDQELLRSKAAGILLRAAEDGTLEDVLMKKATMKDPEELRHQAAATLLKAAENGTLEEVLKSKAKGNDLEAIRLEAARALCKAVEVPGTLEAALAKARGQERQERELEVLKQEAALALLKAAEDGSLDKAFAETRGEDLEGLRRAAAETLLIAAKDGRLEQALGGGAAEAKDLEALRQTAADSLLQAAKDGSLEQALEIVKKDFDSVQLDDLRKQAATALLRAAEDGRLASALAPKELEQMRQEAADALLRAAKDGSLEKALLKETRASLTDQEVKDLARNTFEEAALDGRLAKALSQTLASKEVSGEMDVEGLRVAAKDTLLAACADGRLESALKSRARAEVVDSITTWAAEANQVANPKDIQAIKDKAADALVKALGMEDAAPRVPEPEAKVAPSPPSEEMAKLDVKNVKAKACDALQKACFDMQQYHANQAYVVGKTCLMATLFVDMWVAIPMGIFISFLDARLFISHGGDLVDNEVSSRVAVLILYIFIPTVAELTARRFIQGLLDAHLMVAGFRKMLKGISDGEFLTDSNFNIHGDAKCLENLLALNAELTGTSFLSWLWDDKEQHAFQQFVWTDKEEESAPGCLRIHLRNSKGQSVALDACHVKVPDLFGAVQPYHLIALKEDPEQVIEDRPDAQVAGSLPPQLLTSDQRSNRAAASSSEGSLCSSCIVDSMKELSEMTFLLDGSSEHFDMLEAHLRFNRVTDDLTSAMPHLRKFARPVDWGWLSNDIAQYIWTGFSQTSVPGPISVGPMFFRMPYDSSRYLLAKHAQLSLASPLFVHGNSEMDQEGDGIDGQAGQASSSPRPIRLYLHLKNFAPGELPHRSNLSGIGEQSDILDESDTSD